MGVASGCGEQEAGVASGSWWNLWVWLLGVVVSRYIDFLILLIPTPLVSVLSYIYINLHANVQITSNSKTWPLLSSLDSLLLSLDVSSSEPPTLIMNSSMHSSCNPSSCQYLSSNSRSTCSTNLFQLAGPTWSIPLYVNSLTAVYN